MFPATGGSLYFFNPYLVQPGWAQDLDFRVRIGTGALDTHDFFRPRMDRTRPGRAAPPLPTAED